MFKENFNILLHNKLRKCNKSLKHKAHFWSSHSYFNPFYIFYSLQIAILFQFSNFPIFQFFNLPIYQFSDCKCRRSSRNSRAKEKRLISLSIQFSITAQYQVPCQCKTTNAGSDFFLLFNDIDVHHIHITMSKM